MYFYKSPMPRGAQNRTRQQCAVAPWHERIRKDRLTRLLFFDTKYLLATLDSRREQLTVWEGNSAADTTSRRVQGNLSLDALDQWNCSFCRRELRDPLCYAQSEVQSFLLGFGEVDRV